MAPVWPVATWLLSLCWLATQHLGTHRGKGVRGKPASPGPTGSGQETPVCGLARLWPCEQTQTCLPATETHRSLVTAVAVAGPEEALGMALLSPRGDPGRTLRARQRAAGPTVPMGSVKAPRLLSGPGLHGPGIGKEWGLEE